MGNMDKKPIPTDEETWRKSLTPEQYRVLREKGTEPPFSGEYLHAEGDGTFTCAACGNPLFASDTKFNSGCGWPSFDQALPGAVEYHTDTSHGMTRTEITCARCGSHLGHVFDDGPTESGKRYCVNSISLDLEQQAEGQPAARPDPVKE
jgi:peptide-methionine (R)-S-oxide reductase